MQSVLAQVARRLGSSAADSTASEGKIDQIIAYIHAHYAEEISNESLGSQFNYHPNYLNRQMVLFTDKSLHQYLLTYRITKAIELLETTALPVSEVGQAVGFKDFSHFSKLFKLKTGSSPSAFRRARS
jgi:two-component system response regulator YesN